MKFCRTGPALHRRACRTDGLRFFQPPTGRRKNSRCSLVPTKLGTQAHLNQAAVCATVVSTLNHKGINVRKPYRAALAFVLSAICIPALACPDGQYSQWGMCVPEIGGDVGKAARGAQAQIFGNPLEVWINNSRGSAYGSSQPIPAQIRQALEGYVADNVMDRARFKVGDNGILNLAGLTVRYGDASAVTVNDVIVFRNAEDAFNNPALWAHELTHVRQYMEWGVHSFAIQYARNYNDVEAPAYAAGDGYAQWIANQQSPPPPPPPPQPPVFQPGIPSGTLVQQCGCWGPTTGVNPFPNCQSGAVVASACGGICPGGTAPYGWICQ